MASPAPERKSQRSYEFTAVPNSIVENQIHFTPAELRLALMTLQWAGGRTITDEVWEQTTGLDPRMKQMAIKGLEQKGLHRTGEGKRAKYKFEVHAWEAWYRSRPARERARTMGRAKSVSAKPGMQVHPDCRERCQRLCEPSNPVIPFPATPTAKPVSQLPPENPPPEKPSPPPKVNPPTSSIPRDLQQLLGIFLSLGVAMSEADTRKCGKLWGSLTSTERTTALAYALARQEAEWGECATRYIPRPWNYLAEKHWERRPAAKGRDVSMSKMERSAKTARAMFRKEMGFDETKR